MKALLECPQVRRDTDPESLYQYMREKLALNPSLPSDHKVVGFLGLLNDYQGVGIMLETARRVDLAISIS
jgi:hypothetical protein